MEPSSRAARILLPLCLLVAFGILFCTLWPFDPFPPNRVAWLQQTHGIAFRQRGVVLSSLSTPKRSNGQVPISSVADPLDKPCSLELWIKPTQTNVVGTIINIYTPANPYRFLIRQYLVGLIISHDVPVHWRKPSRIKIDVDDGLRKDQLTLLTISSGKNGTSVYFDGVLKKSFSHFWISSDNLSGQVILGSSAVQPDAWTGEIHSLAFYQRELTAEEVRSRYDAWRTETITANANQPSLECLFAEGAGDIIHDQGPDRRDLFMPKTYKVPHHSFLTLPWLEFEPTSEYFWDVVRNVVGFMPLGFLLCSLLSLSRESRRAMLYTTLLGCALSMSVEILQAYIPQRGSGVTDIITNTLGTLFGALLVRPYIIRRLFTRPTVKEIELDSSPYQRNSNFRIGN